MTFVKGLSGNPKGRGHAKGKDKELKMKLRHFMDENIDGFLKDLLKLPPEDKLKYMVLLMPYIIPKLKEGKLEINGEMEIKWIETKTYDPNGQANTSIRLLTGQEND